MPSCLRPQWRLRRRRRRRLLLWGGSGGIGGAGRGYHCSQTRRLRALAVVMCCGEVCLGKSSAFSLGRIRQHQQPRFHERCSSAEWNRVCVESGQILSKSQSLESESGGRLNQKSGVRESHARRPRTWPSWQPWRWRCAAACQIEISRRRGGFEAQAGLPAIGHGPEERKQISRRATIIISYEERASDTRPSTRAGGGDSPQSTRTHSLTDAM